MAEEKILVQHDGFYTQLQVGEKREPEQIRLIKESTGDTLVIIYIDAVDNTASCDARPLKALSQAEAKSAIKCLSNTLITQCGGKNFLAVPNDLHDLFINEGFHLVPRQRGDSNKYFDALLYISNAQKSPLTNWLTKHQEKLNHLKNSYKIITDKSVLLTRCQDISNFLFKNARFAHDPQRYGEEAVRCRIKNPSVTAFAVVENNTNNIVGFMRIYKAPGIGHYASDLLVATSARNQGLATLIIQTAFEIGSDFTYLFLIGGTSEVEKIYCEKMGAKYFHKDPFIHLDEDTSFVFKISHTGKLVSEFRGQLAPPETKESFFGSVFKPKKKTSSSNKEVEEHEQHECVLL